MMTKIHKQEVDMHHQIKESDLYIDLLLYALIISEIYYNDKL